MPQKVTPYLWYNDNAEEAANFYVSIFEHAEVTCVRRYGDGGPGPAGSVISVTFRLDGQEFTALNGGPMFAFTDAVSLAVDCDSQEEVDYYWEKLTAGGRPGPCGWLEDKFGLSWQVNPRILHDLLHDRDPVKANRVMHALLQMSKIEIARLEEAYAGSESDGRSPLAAGPQPIVQSEAKHRHPASAPSPSEPTHVVTTRSPSPAKRERGLGREGRFADLSISPPPNRPMSEVASRQPRTDRTSPRRSRR